MGNDLKIVAIANPISGHHQAPYKWPSLLKTMGRKAANVITWWTEGPGHAEILAARARREEFDRVIVVGGDGTLFEVVNGLWWEKKGKLPSLGVVPFGIGCDYVRNFETGQSLIENLATALEESEISIDAGICNLQGLDGKPRERIFVNILGLGFDANVIKRFKRRYIKLRGKIPYIISIIQEWTMIKHYSLEGAIDGNLIEADIIIFVLGLGRFFGAGMMIAPNASPQANRFQIVWGQDINRLEVLGLFRHIYAGQHTNHPKVRIRYARNVKVLTNPTAYIEAEGELIGRTPIEVKVFPSAFFFATKSIKKSPNPNFRGCEVQKFPEAKK